MYDYLKEMCLCDYFMIRMLMKNHEFDGQAVFAKLAKAYLLTKAQTAALYADAENPSVAEMTNKAAYARYKRMRSYGAMLSGVPQEPDPLAEIIDIQGGAVACLDAAEFFKIGSASQSVRSYLDEVTAIGSVALMRVVGFMKTEGLLFDRNVDDGHRLILAAADWNNAEALFLALHYGIGDRMRLLSALCFVLEKESKSTAAARAVKMYGTPEKRPDDVALLESCFASGALRRNVYSAPHAEIVGSRIIPIQDKRELMSVTDGRILRSQIATVPLGLDPERRPECDFASASRFGYLRSTLPSAIEQWLTTVQGDEYEYAFRPLCICADSNYVLNACAAALEKCLGDAHVERIYVGELEPVDFAPAPHNVFVSSCDATAPNVYFMYYRGEISPENFERASAFLKRRYRQNFKLDNPSVKLDLGSVLPVCFCEPQYVARLGKSCDVIKITDPTSEEKSAMIGEILKAKAAKLKIPTIALADGVADKLAELSIDEINKVLAIVSRKILIKKNKEAIITAEAVEEVRRESSTQGGGFGFGGYDYDIK